MRECSSRAPITDLPDLAADVFARLRERAPRVHCLTNAVAQAFTANVLLAVGAIPSMTIAPDEIEDFVGRADALLINLGTFDGERTRAAQRAVARAQRDKKPWVLDPVLIDRSPLRAEFARQLADGAPTAIRLNGAEFRALWQQEPSRAAVLAVAQANGAVLALTGANDVVTDGGDMVEIANGHPLMGKVTAMGCALSAVLAGCLAVQPDPFVATASALLAFGVAGEMAAEQARGPGTFAVAMIDALYAIDLATLRARGRLA